MISYLQHSPRCLRAIALLFARSTYRLCMTVAATLALASRLRAQETMKPSQSFWITPAVGIAGPYLLATDISASYSRNSIVATINRSSAETLHADGVHSHSILVGARTENPNRFFSATLGVARAYQIRKCDDCGATTSGPATTALAFAFGAHVNPKDGWIGASVNLAGDVGPTGTRYVAALVGLDVGRFGF